jgi:outer membrane protein OmpA-like peptidoglycan-associated protein
MRNHPKVLLFLLCMISLSSFAQTALLDKGDKAYEQFDFKEAMFFYESANDAQPNDAGISRRIAMTYRRMGELEKAAEWYQKTIEMDASNADDMLHYAEILKMLSKYDEAIEWYKMYAKLRPNDSRAISHLKEPFYYRNLFADTARYSMKRFEINAENPVLGISLFEDEKYLVSAVHLEKVLKSEKEIIPYLDVYLCELDENNELVNPIKLDVNVNSTFHDGPAYYCFADKKLYITRTNMKGKKPKFNKNGNAILKIFESEYENGVWTPAKEMRFNDEGFSNGQPCLSKDGQTMYFFSDRSGGFGGTDIYVCYKSGNGWSDPVNLGPNVNTEGNEQFPFLGEDGMLYFASNGHAGLGGMDIFYSKQIGEVWQIPSNMGAPINSSQDDFSLMYDKESDNGFFCSNRSGRGDDDIYFYKHIDVKTMMVAGTIKANNPNISLAGERIKITKMNDGEVMYQALDEYESFAFGGKPGDNFEVVMMDAEYFDPNKPVFTYTIESPILDPYVNIGDQQAEFKKMPTRTGQLGIIRNMELAIAGNPDLNGSNNLSNLDKYDANGNLINAEDGTLANTNGTKDAMLTKAKQAEFDKKIAQADLLFKSKKYVAARDAYTTASKLMPENNYAKSQLEKCEEAANAQTTAQLSTKIETADKLFEQGKWGDAKAAYKAALAMDPENDHIMSQIALVDEELKIAEVKRQQEKYDDKIEAADRLFAQRKYVEAKAAYKVASAMKPDEVYPKKQIENVSNILNPKKTTTETAKVKMPSEFDTAEPVVDLVGMSMDNIVFDYNKTYIREEDKPLLDKLFQVMLDNPNTKLLIRAHCDSRGSMAYNQSLSMSRAMEVQGYLMRKGIKRDRIKTEWFGEQRPLNGCIDDVPCEEGEYEVNRRAEFKLVAMPKTP